MNILMNIIVLIFEVLYYSMFMYYAKKEGKFWRYILLFSLITIIGLFIGTNYLLSFLLLVIMMIYGLKYIVKEKISLYDMLIIFFMLLLNFLIPMPIYYFTSIFTKNVFIITIVYQVIKFLIVFGLKYKLNKFYNFFHNLWNNNNFYIRYIFTTFMYLFVIFSCIYSIYK